MASIGRIKRALGFPPEQIEGDGDGDGGDGKPQARSDKNHGNTRLPFGLCKNFGIPLPDNATPRDAWDALKGIHVRPPWEDGGVSSGVTDDGKQKPQEANTETKAKEISKKVAKQMEKLTGSLSVYKEGFLNFFNDGHLDDNELNIFANTIDFVPIRPNERQKTSWFTRPRYSKPGDLTNVAIELYPCKQTNLDKEFGYEGSPKTICHEYGHYLDWFYGEISRTPDCIKAYNKDAIPLVNRFISMTPNVEPIKSFTRTPSLEQVEALFDGIRNTFNISRKTLDQTSNLRNRLGFLCDFIGCLTGNKLMKKICIRTGLFGHLPSDYKTYDLGSEPWAEYVSMRMTKDEEGLKLFKEFLPNVYEQFEKEYNELGRKKKK